MQPFRSETLKPIFSIALAIVVLLLLIRCYYHKGYFSTPEASNAIQAAFVGILVILTAYYAYATHKQANIIKIQSEGVFWQKIIEYALLPWMKCLKENNFRFRNLWFHFFIYHDDFRVELPSLVPRTDEKCESYFMKKHDNVARRMKAYKKEAWVLEKNLIDFARKFWVEELSNSVEAFLKNKSGGREWEVSEVLELTIRKFLMREDQFKEVRLADRFDSEVWEPFLKEALRASSPLAEEKERIRAESLELSDKSAELYEKLSAIQFQLCEKYSLLYQSLTV